MKQASTGRLSRLDSQVSVDAAPDTRDYLKGPVVQETSLTSRNVSMDALPRNDPAPLQMRNYATESSVHPQPVISRGGSRIASSDVLSHQSYEPMDICKSLQDKIISRLDSKNESCIEESSYCSSSTFCSSIDDDSWLQELKYYEKYMPADIKIGYFDVMILYSEQNYNEASIFCDHLKTEIVMKNQGSVKAVLYDCDELISLAGSKLKHLEKALERCTYVFIYMTKEFCDDTWMELSSEECLMKAIYDEEKRWCVVPVYTVSRRNANFKIPMGLNSLKGINYYNNDQFYRNGVSRLIEDKLNQRLKNEDKHRQKQFAWLQQHKRNMITEEENRKRLEHMEKLKYERHIMEEQRRTEELLKKDLNQQHPMDNSNLGKYYQGMHYSYSEPGLQNKFNNIPLSASSGCLVQIDAKGNPYFAPNFSPNSCVMPNRYNMAGFGNASVDPYLMMQSNAMNGIPPHYLSHMSAPPQYSDVVTTSQSESSQQGLFQPLRYNQQERTQPVLYHQQAPSQMYQQCQNVIPVHETHSQIQYNQSLVNNQQMQNEMDLNTRQRVINQGLVIQPLDQSGTPNTGLRTNSNMQQSVYQAADNFSSLCLQGMEPAGIQLGMRENKITGGDDRNPPHGESHLHGNESPSNNSTLSSDQLSQDPIAVEDAYNVPNMSMLASASSDFTGNDIVCQETEAGPNPLPTSYVDCSTGNDMSLQEARVHQDVVPNFSALSLDLVDDGRSLTSVESGGKPKTSASHLHGSNMTPHSQSEMITTPTESDTETIRKAGEGVQKVVIHHHYYYHDKERDDPKVINIYDAKTVQIGDSPTVIESKEGQKKSKSSKKLSTQAEKTEVKFTETLQDVARKEIDEGSLCPENLPVTGIAELKVEHPSVASQQDSKQSQDCISVSARTSHELKHSLLSNKDEEKGEDGQSLRTQSKDHNKSTMEEKEVGQGALLPKVNIVPNMEKKNLPILLETKPKDTSSRPVAKVPPSPSVTQIQPFKKEKDSDNEETFLKTIGRAQRDDTQLKTVHETGTRAVYGTQIVSEETSPKLVAPSRAINRASPVKGGSQTDLNQYQATIQSKTANRASPVKGGSRTDLNHYQATIQSKTANRASPVRERPQIDLSQTPATLQQMATRTVTERPQTNLGLFQAAMRSTSLRFNGPSIVAAASSLRSDTVSTHHVPLGEDPSSQDELDGETDVGPPESKGFVPNPHLEKEEWYYLDTDSIDAREPSESDSSNSRRRKKANSSSTDNKSCTVS